jgi:ribosomal protein L11 methyltransferase
VVFGTYSPLPKAQYQKIEQTDWSQSWKKHYQPSQLAAVVIVQLVGNPLPERIPIRIDPGMGFGTVSTHHAIMFGDD